MQIQREKIIIERPERYVPPQGVKDPLLSPIIDPCESCREFWIFGANHPIISFQKSRVYNCILHRKKEDVIVPIGEPQLDIDLKTHVLKILHYTPTKIAYYAHDRSRKWSLLPN